MRFFALLCNKYALFLYNMFMFFVVQWVENKAKWKGTVFCVAFGSERNVYSMWNGMIVGDMWSYVHIHEFHAPPRSVLL